MASAKDIIIKPISRQDADRVVKQLHYSGKTVNNAQLHFGVFLDGKCGGALQFGPSLDKRKVIGVVADTKWNDFIELNRMALADWLPKNSESRAISVCMKLLKKSYPNLEWVVSFADPWLQTGVQCRTIAQGSLKKVGSKTPWHEREFMPAHHVQRTAQSEAETEARIDAILANFGKNSTT